MGVRGRGDNKAMEKAKLRKDIPTQIRLIAMNLVEMIGLDLRGIQKIEHETGAPEQVYGGMITIWHDDVTEPLFLQYSKPLIKEGRT